MRKTAEGWLALIVALSGAAGLLVFVYQTVRWLRFGDWPELPIAEVFHWNMAAIEWVGIRQILGLIGQIGLAPFLVLGPFLAFSAALSIADMRK